MFKKGKIGDCMVSHQVYLHLCGLCLAPLDLMAWVQSVVSSQNYPELAAPIHKDHFQNCSSWDRLGKSI